MGRVHIGLSAVLLSACQGASPVLGPGMPVPAAQPFSYEPDLPPFYLEPVNAAADNTPSDNAITDEGATLGRVLFYDRELSRNRTVSCASCHLATRGFADGVSLSRGFEGNLTRRNSMGLSNARYYRPGRFFWDERAPTLEAQVLMPFQDPVEMGLGLEELLARVAAASYYPPLFEAAFGDRTVTADGISRALAQFIRSMVSYRSRYDEGRAQVARVTDRFPNFTDQENLGRQLFFNLGRTGCAICHVGDTFVVPVPRNNGLDAVTADQGVGQRTGNPRDLGRFKAPSLRNVGLTAPYMHDGRFDTLERVVQFYDSGVQDSPNLDPLLLPGGRPRRLELTGEERAALVAFLHTLTDLDMVSDPKFSNPFREP